MTTRAATRETARAQSTRSGRVPQQLIDELIRPGLGQKDVRLRSLAPTARKQEAIRRLNDPETAAGKPGTNLCRYAGNDKQMTGKRPGYYTERNIGASAVWLCKELIDEAWSDPAFLKEEKIVCGDDKKWIFAHQRGNKRIKGHCRKVDAPRPRAKKDPREKKLAALIRERDDAKSMSQYTALNAQIKALRAELQPRPAVRKAAPVRPAVPPPSAQAPVRKQTRRTPTPFSTGEIPDYLNSLARGERANAERSIRQYMEGPGQLNSLEALQAYKDRKLYDAQLNVGPTAFDDSGEEDQDLGNFGSGLDGARAEHAERGDNALDGSQLAELLAGQGGAPTIAAY